MVRKIAAELLLDARATLGEGPAWVARDRALLWVDIDNHLVHRTVPETLADDTFDVGESVGAVVPRERGGLALAVRHGFALADAWRGPIRKLATVEENKPKNRMNDGKCDRRGRFWAGMYGKDGGLYRLDPDGRVTQMLGGIACSNGIAWTADDRTMYYIDSVTKGVDAFDYGLEDGSIAARRRVITVADATPDGMTIDAEGCLWVALWGGRAVRRYTPDGRIDTEIAVPALQVTSCVFGGPKLEDLYITCARTGRSPSDLADEPHAGGVFVCRPGVVGTATVAYGG
jgi:sugar lactone lactonase YvrE